MITTAQGAAGLVVGAALFVSATLGYTAGHNWHPAERCQEDEVYAVQVDHDPHHRLTWACTNRETVVTQYLHIPINAFWPAR